jgi:hypothetical protein
MLRTIICKSVFSAIFLLLNVLSIQATIAATPLQNKAFNSDALLKKLPYDQRTFAKPLALGRNNLLIFQRDGSNAVVWNIDWKKQKVSSFVLPELTLLDKLRYTVIANKEGLWFLGEISMLIRPNGDRLTLNTGFSEPVAVALNDQSVLVLGHSSHGAVATTNGSSLSSTNRIFQLKPNFRQKSLSKTDRGILSYDGKPNHTGEIYREPSYGHSAIKLDDGRILILGGGNTEQLASVIEPHPSKSNWSIKPVAAVPKNHGRVFGAATLLPNGHVVIVGAPHNRCYDKAELTRSVDTFDIKSNKWSNLPALPFVPCADAYGGDAPSITTTPNGSIVVGAHLEPHVMILHADVKSPTGYVSNWQVYGNMPKRRISGVVQAISNQEIIVAGGVDNISGDFGGCCYATAGFDHISINVNNSKDFLAAGLIGAGVAKRGKWIFAGSGRRFGFTSSGQMRYSGHAELLDTSNGKVRQLPNIPFTSGAAQAFWLDDNRILLKGIKESHERGFEIGGGLSSYMPPSSAAIAIFSIDENKWSEPINLPELQEAKVITIDNNKVLLSNSNQILTFSLETNKVQKIQPTLRGRRGSVTRVLDNSILMLTGGSTQTDTISVMGNDCETLDENKCPELFVGFGAYSQFNSIEEISLESNSTSSNKLLVTLPSNAISTVITKEGRVISLGIDPDNPIQNELMILYISPEDRTWNKFALPSDLVKDKSGNCGHCVLSLIQNPRDPESDLLFLRQGAIELDYWDDKVASELVNVWYWEEITKHWHQVLKTSGSHARSSPLALGNPLSLKQGKRMISLGWHTPEAILWIEE